MPKEVKKSYYYLNLEYNSSKEEIDDRYNQILEKFSQIQSKNKAKFEKKLNKLENSYNLINSYIKEFGLPKENRTNVTVGEILTQTFVLVLVIYILIKLIISLI